MVSVILPVRNEASTILAAIRSALNQAYAGDLEIVVADGGSTDGTREIVEELGGMDPRIRLVDNPPGITPTGLNAAIRAANGEVIVRLDGHSVLPDGYIARAVETLHREGADNVGGVQAAVGDGWIQRATAAAMSNPVGVGDARFHYGGESGPADTVYLGVFRREVFDRIGFFDETLLRNQDYELNYRIRTSGGIVWFDPELRVEYRPRTSVRGLWRQYSQYGAWKREVLRRHPSSLRWRQLVPPIFVLALLASALLSFTTLRAWGTVVPLLYLAALTVTTLTELARRKQAAMVLLPVVLTTMHIAWGTGFLVGRRIAAQSTNRR